MTSSPSRPCAVVDCPNEGHRQVCPYDWRYHHHGRIHYENDHPAHPHLRFRPITDGWLEVCDPHITEINTAVRALHDA